MVKEATGKKKGGFVCIFVDDRWCSDVTERTALLHRWWTRHCHPAVWEFRQISVTNVGKPQALVYDILPSTTAVFSYVTGSRKLSANEQFFVGAQTVVSLLQTTQIKQGVPFIAADKVYISTNKTTIDWIETKSFFYPGWMRLMFTWVLGR